MTPGEYRKKLDIISAGLLVTVLRILRAALRIGVSEKRRRAASVELTFAVRAARAEVAALTADYLRAAGAAAGHGDVYLPTPPGYPPDAAVAVLDDALARQERHGWTARQAAGRTAPAFIRHAEQAGRDLVYEATEPRDPPGDEDGDDDDFGLRDEDEERAAADNEAAGPPPTAGARPVAWARGLTGADNCGFCVMLASRGAVYRLKPSAMRRSDMTLYHDNCDCIAIPVYTSKDWPGKSEADRLRALWLRATKGSSQKDALNALRRELARMTREGEQIAPDIRVAA